MALGPLNPSTLLKSGVTASLTIGTYTADQTGQNSQDTLGFEYALVAIALGTVASGGYADIVIKESSDDFSSDAAAAITGASYSLTGTDDNTIVLGQIRLSNRERYLRADYDETATGSSAVAGVWIIPMTPRDMAAFQTSDFAFTVV